MKRALREQPHGRKGKQKKMTSNMNNEALTYDDVLLQPQFSEIRSRTDINIGSDWGMVRIIITYIFLQWIRLLVVTWLHRYTNGGAGIIHRYNTIEEQVLEVKMLISIVSTPLHQYGAAIGGHWRLLERNSFTLCWC